MMRTLLWRDYRQNRRVLLVVGSILAAPYVFTLLLSFAERILRTPHTGSLADAFFAASAWATILATGMSAFIAGNAFAGERADRSAEFAAHLPIDRKRMLWARLLLGTGAAITAYILNLMVMATPVLIHYDPVTSRGVVEFLREFAFNSIATLVLLFGVSWLVSSFTSSAVISAAAGLAAMVLLAGSLISIDNYFSGYTLFGERMQFLYAPLGLLIGLVGLVAGCVVVMRRKTP